MFTQITKIIREGIESLLLISMGIKGIDWE